MSAGSVIKPKPRAERLAATRATLIAAARRAFGEKGYAEASMHDFTAEAGLTRGALYHHFGDKKGLLMAVILQIDSEMATRLNAISAAAPDRWQGFVDENVGYIEMALEPEIQRIVLRDGPAVLGDLISLGRSPTRPMACRMKKRLTAGSRSTAASPASRARRTGNTSFANVIRKS